MAVITLFYAELLQIKFTLPQKLESEMLEFLRQFLR